MLLVSPEARPESECRGKGKLTDLNAVSCLNRPKFGWLAQGGQCHEYGSER